MGWNRVRGETWIHFKHSSTSVHACLEAGSKAPCRAYHSTNKQHTHTQVWIGLRAELLAPSAYGLTGPDLAAARKLSQRAAQCLTTCCRALGPNSLDKCALEDPRMSSDLLSALGAAGGAAGVGGGGDVGRQDRYVLCVAEALCAVGGIKKFLWMVVLVHRGVFAAC